MPRFIASAPRVPPAHPRLVFLSPTALSLPRSSRCDGSVHPRRPRRPPSPSPRHPHHLASCHRSVAPTLLAINVVKPGPEKQSQTSPACERAIQIPTDNQLPERRQFPAPNLTDGPVRSATNSCPLAAPFPSFVARRVPPLSGSQRVSHQDLVKTALQATVHTVQAGQDLPTHGPGRTSKCPAEPVPVDLES